MTPEPLPDQSAYREGWLSRGRDLNEIYDVLAQIVREPAPGFDPVADLRALGVERDRYRRALENIQELEGKVCPQYELCEHVSCASSYGAWSIADGALRCTEPLGEPFGDDASDERGQADG